MFSAARIVSIVAILLTGAIFGFFYAWVCSTMWGLDQADPRVALDAMKAMNGSVRNAVFAPAFFGTPVALATAAVLWWRARQSRPALLFAAAGLVYLALGLVLTMTVNVPMNEALAALATPTDIEAARMMWNEYSQPWQFWNQLRTLASGVALLLAAMGLASVTRSTAMQLSG